MLGIRAGKVMGLVTAYLTQKGVLTAAGAPACDASALKIANNLADLETVAMARTNLGLGTAALLNHGTTNGDLVRLDAIGLPAIDGSRLTGLAAGSSVYTLVATEAGLTAALAASAPLIALTTSFSLTANAQVVEDCEIKILEGVIWTLTGFQVNVTAAKDLTTDGPGTVTGLGSVADTINLGAGARWFTKGDVKLTWTAAAAGYPSAAETHLRNSTLNLFNGIGTQSWGVNALSTMDDCHIVGGGSLCRDAVLWSTFARVSGVRVTGAFNGLSVMRFAGDSVSGITDASTGNHKLSVCPKSGSGINTISNGTLPVTASDSHLTGYRAINGTIEISGAARVRLVSPYANALSIISGSYDANVIGGHFAANFTLVSTSPRAVISGARFDGTVTIDSGSKARFIGCVIIGALINNDPTGTEIIGCVDGFGNQIPDQRIGVGRFNNATLDGEFLQRLRCMYRLSETGVLSNSAPHGKPSRIVETGTVSVERGLAGKLVGSARSNAVGEYLYDFEQMYSIGGLTPFQMGGWFKLDAIPVGIMALMAMSTPGGAGSGGFYIAVNSIGRPSMVQNGNSILGLTAISVGTWFHVAMRRYNNAGTMTAEFYINGVSQGTTTFVVGYRIDSFPQIFTVGGFDQAVPMNGEQVYIADYGDEDAITAIYNAGAGRVF